MITKFKIFENKSNPLIEAAKNSSSAIVRNILNNDKFDVNEIDYQNWTALFYGVWNDNINIVIDLIKANADVNIKDDEGTTALKIAASFADADNNFDIIKELISAGAELEDLLIDKKDCFEILPIEYQKEIITKYPDNYKRYLLKKGQEKYNL
jgi:ankyrin repeat protein